ncbi:MAG: SH3 domain-containing protein [Anaerolineae bacterium]|nr:SH3 domain-containing protein [Anaerolineae bacterium]
MKNPLSRVVISTLLLAALLVGAFSVYAQDEEPTFRVAAEEAVLRDTAHDVLGENLETLWPGRVGTLLGRSRAGSFVYVKMDSGATGWVRVANIETDFNIEDLPVQQSGRVEIIPPTPPLATVTVDTLLRDTAHEVMGKDIETVPAGEGVEALGITRAGNYIYVKTITGAQGWLFLADAELNIGATALPVEQSGKVEITQPVEPAFTVTGDAALRDRPADRFKPVDKVWEGRTGTLLGKTMIGTFAYVEMDNGAQGWLSFEVIDTDYPTERLPVVTEVEIVEPVSKDFTVTGDAELADRPAATYKPVDTVWEGRTGTLLGRTMIGSYVYVAMDNGAQGWLPADVVESAYPIEALPVVTEAEIIAPASKDFTVTGVAELADRPAATYKPVDTVWKGRTGTLEGTTMIGSYVYVAMDNGAQGWLPADAVKSAYPLKALPVVTEAEIVAPMPKTFTVTGDAELADRPAATYKPVEALWAGRTGTLEGATMIGSYVYVTMDSGAQGWLPVEAIETAYPLATLPVVTKVEIAGPTPVVATVTAESTPLRDTAHDSLGEDIETLPAGEEAKVMGITRGGRFVYAETITGAKGWLALSDVELNVDAAVLPVEQSGAVELAMPAITPAFTVAGDASLRDAAHDTVSQEVEPLWAGRTGTLLGVTRGGSFYYVAMDSGAQGWLRTGSVETEYPIARLPVEQSGQVEIVAPPAADFEVTGDGAVRDTAHDAVGADIDPVWEGRTGTLLGVTRGGNFYYAAMDNGAKGWIGADIVSTAYPVEILKVEQSGQVETAAPLPKTFTVTAETMLIDGNLRDDPIDTLTAGETGTLVSRTSLGNYIYVEMDSTAKGWVPVDAIATDYNLTALQPVISSTLEAAPAPAKTFTLADAGALLAWPSANTGGVVVALPADSAGTLVGRLANDKFAFVEMDNGATGWLEAGAVTSAYPIHALPALKPAEAAIAVIGVITPETGLNVRQAANADAEIITALPQGEVVVLLGRAPGNEWLRVRAAGDVEGWVASQYIRTEYDINELPEMTGE